MASQTEQVLDALVGLLVPIAQTERNIAVPERIPAGGLIVVRDGDPGDPDRTLGGFSSVYYTHEIEVEVYVAGGDDAARDDAFDALVVAIGGALDGSPTLGGLASGMTYARPAVDLESIEGAAAIKFGIIPLIVEYEAPSALG